MWAASRPSMHIAWILMCPVRPTTVFRSWQLAICSDLSIICLAVQLDEAVDCVHSKVASARALDQSLETQNSLCRQVLRNRLFINNIKYRWPAVVKWLLRIIISGAAFRSWHAFYTTVTRLSILIATHWYDQRRNHWSRVCLPRDSNLGSLAREACNLTHSVTPTCQVQTGALHASICGINSISMFSRSAFDERAA